jgi:predicted transcriptional regulator of viral defense system
MGALLKVLARSVLEDAEEHVRRVRATDLDYTVVRAPRLVDGEGAGDYRAGDIDLGFESVSRADVARFILDCIEDERYVGGMPKVGAA